RMPHAETPPTAPAGFGPCCRSAVDAHLVVGDGEGHPVGADGQRAVVVLPGAFDERLLRDAGDAAGDAVDYVAVHGHLRLGLLEDVACLLRVRVVRVHAGQRSRILEVGDLVHQHVDAVTELQDVLGGHGVAA